MIANGDVYGGIWEEKKRGGIWWKLLDGFGRGWLGLEGGWG